MGVKGIIVEIPTFSGAHFSKSKMGVIFFITLNPL